MADRELIPLTISGGPSVRDVTVRDVRRPELEEYMALALANTGEIDHRLGLSDRAKRELGSLFSARLWFLLRLLRLVGRPPVRLLMAEEQGRVVGTTMTLSIGPWAYVAAVGVREDRRNRGIAQALLRRAEEIGRRGGKQCLVLDVAADNEPARRLYAKLGWVPRGTVQWWELPSTHPTAGRPGARLATTGEPELARSVSENRLGLALPRGALHPCEVMCRGTGGPHETLAAGPNGAPTLVLRYWAGREGESGFVLPVVTGGVPDAGEEAALEAARAGLFHRGNRGLFVPVLGDDPPLETLVRRCGGTPTVRSEVWSRTLAPR